MVLVDQKFNIFSCSHIWAQCSWLWIITLPISIMIRDLHT